MKAALCLLLFLASSPLLAFESLSGEWKLNEMIYKGSSIGLPNPDLNLRWSFFSNGTSRLYWDRGSAEFCERFASYSMKAPYLEESVFAINPQNAVDCKADPDMQIGRKTATRMTLKHHELQFYFQLGDDELIYVLKKMP